jgi:hypothetical protein
MLLKANLWEGMHVIQRMKNEENDKETWCREEEEWESGAHRLTHKFAV